jgi:hypothetical protein
LQRQQLSLAELNGPRCTDGAKSGANAASFSYVLQAAHQRLPGVPGDGDVAAGERDGDPIEAFGHGIDPIRLLLDTVILRDVQGDALELGEAPALLSQHRCARLEQEVIVQRATVEGRVGQVEQDRDVVLDVVPFPPASNTMTTG